MLSFGRITRRQRILFKINTSTIASPDTQVSGDVVFLPIPADAAAVSNNLHRIKTAGFGFCPETGCLLLT